MDTAISEKNIKPGFFSRRRLAGLCLLFVVTFLFAHQAQALAIDTGGFSFSCGAGGLPGDGLNPDDISAKCDADPNAIFSSVLCNFEATLAQVMQRVECAMQQQAVGPIAAVLALYIVILGISFLTGIVNLTSKEAGTAVFKVALVIAFTLGGSFSYEYGYKVFAGFAQQGTQIMFNIIDKHEVADPTSACADSMTGTVTERHFKAMDAKIASGVLFTSEDNSKVTDPDAKETGGPCLADAYKAMPKECSNFILLIIFIATMLIPILPTIVGYSLVKYGMLFARAVLGYLAALFFLTLLFVMAPIFVSFGLFARTRELFEKWLQYLVTYGLQIVIVFAFFAMANLYNVMDFITQLASLVKVDPKPNFAFSLISYIPFLNATPCSLCNMEIVQGGKTVLNFVDKVITPAAGSTPAVTDSVLQCNDPKDIIPLFDIVKHGTFLTWVFVRFIGMIVLVGVLEDFLEKAPELARNLGTVRYAAVIGGESGDASTNLNFVGLKSAGAGMEGFYDGVKHSKRFGPLQYLDGFSKGIDSFATGEKTDDWEERMDALKQQEAEILEKQKSARTTATIYFDALKDKISEGKSSDLATIDFWRSSWEQASDLETEQARKLKTIQRNIQNLQDNPQVTRGGMAQEIDEMDSVGELKDAGKRSEYQDRATQEWYNMLGGESAEESQAQAKEVNEMRNYAQDLIGSIRGSKDFNNKNLSSYDRSVLEDQLADLENATSYDDVEQIKSSVSTVTHTAQKLGIRW